MTPKEWNAMYPVGVLVRYFPIKGHLDEFEDLLTRSEAITTNSGDGAIFLKNKSGYVNLEHVTPLENPTQKKTRVVSGISAVRSSRDKPLDGKARAKAKVAVGNWE
jgi:hypothetical protein